MSNLTTLPKGDSAWLLRKAIERLMQQVSVLETNIGSSTTGNSADTQIIFNDNGTLRGDTGLVYNKSTDLLSFGAGLCYGALSITGDLTVDTSTLKVDSANNRVGIGTASPSVPFEVSGNSKFGGNYISLNGNAYIRTDATNKLRLQMGSSGFELSDSTNTTLVGSISNSAPAGTFAIDAGGNLGLGVTPSAWGLAGGAAAQLPGGAISSYATSNFTIAQNAFFNGTDWKYKNTAAASYYQQTAGTHLWFNAASGSAGNTITDFATAVMTLNANAALVLKGGNTSANGVGIAFPSTQAASSDANTLDDYEEGTWTGTLTGGTTNPTTPVTATGRYTKIGRVVTVQISFSNVNTTGASGLIGITGLPFANNGSVGTNGSVALYLIATFTGSPFASIGVNESFINLYANNSGGAFTDVTHNAGASKYLTASVTYTVA